MTPEHKNIVTNIARRAIKRRTFGPDGIVFDGTKLYEEIRDETDADYFVSLITDELVPFLNGESKHAIEACDEFTFMDIEDDIATVTAVAKEIEESLQ